MNPNMKSYMRTNMSTKVCSKLCSDLCSQMNANMSTNMSTLRKDIDRKDSTSLEALIHEWMSEDRFLTRYTKRQRAILCKKLISKLNEQDKVLEDALAAAKEATEEMELKLKRYRKAYQTLLRDTYSVRYVECFCQLIWMAWIIWLSIWIVGVYQSFTSSIQLASCQATESNQTVPYKRPALTW